MSQKISIAENRAQTGFSTQRLKRIDNNINEWVSKGRAGSRSLYDGGIVPNKAAGYNDAESKTAMQKMISSALHRKQKVVYSFYR